jgi:hypothetical protein
VDPARAVELYVERLNLPEIRARIVYQRVLARIAESELPRLNEGAAPAPAAERPVSPPAGAAG